MKAYLTRRYMFSASHRLQNDAMSVEENRTIYGKCNNPYGHGHNYMLEVTVSGQVAEDTGMVCNLADLDGLVYEKIIGHFDLQNLNTLAEFAKLVPTTENLCVVMFDTLNRDILQRRLGGAHLERVRFEETMMNSFEYAGGREIRH